MIKKVLFLLATLPCFLAFAQTTSVPLTSGSVKEYEFTVKSPSKKTPARASLKLSESKDFVYLYFEGSDLQSGKYKLYKTESCSTLAKQIRSKKSLKEDDELYSFETKYGNFSGEKNLPFKNFQELGIGHIAVALIKIERKNNIVTSCVN